MALVFEVKVVPNAKKHKWILDKAGRLVCYVKNKAERGAANKELLKETAEIVGVPQSKVTLVHGFEGRNKIIKISESTLTYEKLLTLLGIEQQTSLIKNSALPRTK
jgi:uncharacterized protein YggU (UPF0235/DUF167 family)